MKINGSERRKGIIVLILISALYAMMGVFSRYLNTYLPLFQQVYFRVFAAFLFALVIFNKNLDFGKIRKISGREWGLLVFRSASTFLFSIVFLTKAYILTKYSNVSFISSLPVTAFLAVFLLNEKLTWKKTILIASAFIGAIFISVKDYSNLMTFGQGELYALLSALFWSITMISRKWHSRLLNDREISTMTFFIAFILLFLTSVLSGEGMPAVRWNTDLLLMISLAGMFVTASILFTNYGMRRVEGILAGNILTLEAFFGLFFGFIYYRELPNMKEFIGGILIVLSVIQMNKLEGSKKKLR